MHRTGSMLALTLLLVAGPASATVDVTGTWRVYFNPDYAMTSPEQWEFLQTGTVVDLNSTHTGTIDTGTGLMEFDVGPSPVAFCPNSEFGATVDQDSLTFAGTWAEYGGAMCHPLAARVVASRCINAPLDPGEDCITPFTTAAGTSLRVRDKGGDASRRKIVLVSRDAAIRPPVLGTAGDPLREGATFIVARGVAEVMSISLPATRWIGLGNPAGSTGYRYSDPQRVSGPCRSAVLKPGHLRVACSGSGIGFSLDEPMQGSLAVTFAPGRGVRSCLSFGGTVVKDTTAAAVGQLGVFRAVSSGAPAACTPEVLPP